MCLRFILFSNYITLQYLYFISLPADLWPESCETIYSERRTPSLHEKSPELRCYRSRLLGRFLWHNECQRKCIVLIWFLPWSFCTFSPPHRSCAWSRTLSMDPTTTAAVFVYLNYLLNIFSSIFFSLSHPTEDGHPLWAWVYVRFLPVEGCGQHVFLIWDFLYSLLFITLYWINFLLK